MVRPLHRTGPLTQCLLVHHEPAQCLIIADHLRTMAGAVVKSTSNMSEGTRLIAGGRFDLALIEVVFPDMAGIDLAAAAANQDTSVLLLSDNSSSTEHARRLGYPCLEKPFEVDRVVMTSIAIVQRARMVVRDVATSAEKMDSAMRSLTAEVAEAHRVFDLIISRLGRKKD
jgi:DNA-binding response OmpR family regulator